MTKFILAAVLSAFSLGAQAHGNINFPNCFLGGGYIYQAPYKCQITINDPQPTDDFYHGARKTFYFQDIFFEKLSSWKVENGLAASYTTSRGTILTLIANVSCPVEAQEVDLNVIDISLSESSHNILDLSNVSISKGREMHSVFEVDGNPAEISCTN